MLVQKETEPIINSKLPLIIKQNPSRWSRWFFWSLALFLIILVIMSGFSMDSLEFTGWVVLIIFLVFIGEYIYRLAKRKCGIYTISSEQVSYKNYRQQWSEKLSCYDSFNWYEGLVGHRSRSQYVEWYFILKHSEKSERSIIFDNKMMRGYSKEESYIKWLELSEPLGIPAKTLYGEGVSIADLNFTGVGDAQEGIQANEVKKNPSAGVSIVLKRHMLAVIALGFISIMLFVLLERSFSNGDIYRLSENEMVFFIFAALFWFFCWFWALKTFRFQTEGSNLIIETCVLGYSFRKTSTPLSQFLSVTIQSNSVGTSNLHILKKDGKKLSCNSIKSYQANKVKEWLMELSR